MIKAAKEQEENKREALAFELQVKYGNNFLTSSGKNKAGSICAMDIYTGEVIAMASSPTYDPNKFTHGIKKKDWNEI